MRVVRLLQVVVLLSFILPPAAWAGPITGQPLVPPAENQKEGSGDGDDNRETAQASFGFAPLFDAFGPMIRVSAPIYLTLGAGAFPADGGGDAFSLGGGAADLGNVSFEIAVDTSSGGGGSGSAVVTPTAVPEPAALALMAPGLFLVVRRVLVSRRFGR